MLRKVGEAAFGRVFRAPEDHVKPIPLKLFFRLMQLKTAFGAYPMEFVHPEPVCQKYFNYDGNEVYWKTSIEEDRSRTVLIKKPLG